MEAASGFFDKSLRFGLLTVAFLTINMASIPRLASQQPRLHAPAQDARNTEIRSTDTPLPLPVFTTLAAWEQRKAFLRNQILIAAGLSPMPTKTPLHAQIFGKIQQKDYSIEKVLIETLPGFYLGGNLYRPRNGKAKHPGSSTLRVIGRTAVSKTNRFIPGPLWASASLARDTSSSPMTWLDIQTRSNCLIASVAPSSGFGRSVLLACSCGTPSAPSTS